MQRIAVYTHPFTRPSIYSLVRPSIYLFVQHNSCFHPFICPLPYLIPSFLPFISSQKFLIFFLYYFLPSPSFYGLTFLFPFFLFFLFFSLSIFLSFLLSFFLSFYLSFFLSFFLSPSSFNHSLTRQLVDES